MTELLLELPGVMAAILIWLTVWRWADKKSDRAVWAKLVSHQSPAPGTFDYSLIADLPDTAQRFFRFAIKPGTPLYTVAEISMDGDFSNGTKTKPDYLQMYAEQILAAPRGFVWKLRAGSGVMRISGSDAAMDGNSWSRFWLLGIVPVARAGNNADHARSAFGRYVAETVFWTPAALLPHENIRWEEIDDSTARVTLTYLGLKQAVDLSVDVDGRLTKVVFQRWSNANAEKIFKLQPFGGYLSEYKDFDGFCLPTRIEAGNFFATDDYFAFFRANVRSIQFPH